MKKTILKIVAVSLLVASSGAFASQYRYDTKSLIAIEGSYSSFDIENDATPPLREKIDFSGVGFKIGSETRDYRLFLSIRNSFIDGDYDYAYFYGAEMQYLMNFSSYANLYVGVSGGFANFRFVDSLNASRDLNSRYYGGDIGFNIHLGDSIDLELGARVIKLSNPDSISPSNAMTYTFDNIVSGYTSIVFKYSMD